MVGKKEIVYPFLLECLPFCEDLFWESIFEELAYSKTPSGSYISKGFLTCSYKNKEFVYKLERKDPEILYSDIYTLLKDRLGVLSQKEKLSRKLAFRDFEIKGRTLKCEWNSIRKKTLKDAHYERFVIDMKKKHNLSITKSRYLLSLILVALLFKVISSRDIVFSENKIQSINGISFEEGEVIFQRSLTSSIELSRNTEEDTTISKNWESYLKLLKLKMKLV